MLRSYRNKSAATIQHNELNEDAKDAKVKVSTYLLAIYLFTVPLDFVSVIGGLSFTRIFVILPLIGYALELKLAKIRFDKYMILLGLFTVMIGASYYYSYLPDITLGRFITISSSVALIIVTYMFSFNLRELNILKKTIIYSGVFVMIIMIFFAEKEAYDFRWVLNLGGDTQDPNYINGYMFYTFIFYLSSYIDKRNTRILLVMGMFTAIFLFTGSRGALLALIVATLAYIILWVRSQKNNLLVTSRFIVISLSLLVIVLLALTILPESITIRYSIAFTVQDGAANRFEIWTIALNIFSSSTSGEMLFGQGAGTFRVFTNIGNVAHNIWIESLLEIGIFGTGLLFMLYYVTLRDALKMKEYVIAATFVGYMVMCLSMSLYSYKPIWNIILLTMLLHKYFIEQQNKHTTVK